MTADTPLAKTHLSVDCTVLGFDGKRLEVLLVRRTGEEGGRRFHDMKLPGSLIWEDEELDSAARRVLTELTGLKHVTLTQFRAFGSKDRTKDPKDVHWLEHAQKARVGRIVTVAYIALVKIDRILVREMEGSEALWVPVDAVPPLAFDHNEIISAALAYERTLASRDPSVLFDLLPRKFTATSLRNLYEVVFGRRLNPSNFYKQMARMPYVVALDEFERGVDHRAARYYRFDKKQYDKIRL